MTDIYLYGEITTYNNIAEQIKNTADDITLHINSCGGDIFMAISIAHSLRDNITCVIEGIAGSAATIITSACKNTVICENALFMIHNPLVCLYESYSAEDLDKIKNSLEKIKETVTNIYVKRTGKTAEEIAAMMEAETWFTAQEAVENKFADSIMGAVDTQIEGDEVFVNHLKFKCSAANREKITRVIPPVVNKKVGLYEMLCTMEDQLKSGAENVHGDISDKPDENKMRAQMIAKYANGVI